MRKNLLFITLLLLFAVLPADKISENDRDDMSLLITSLTGSAASVALKEVKVWPGKDSIRVALYPETEVHFKYNLLPGKREDRIYIDLLNTTATKEVLPKIKSTPFLKAVRLGQRGNGVRIVLDSGKVEKYNVMVMAEPYRIVIDYYGKREKKAPPVVAKTEKRSKKIIKKSKKSEKKSQKPFILVIDPGHGGKDPGASRAGVREKDIVLRLAKILKRRSSKMKGLKVILTRNKDIFLPLEERAAMANAQEGDLFISLHANAFRLPAINGVEVYHLDNHRSNYTDKLAMVENKLTNTNSLLNTILVDMTMSFYVNDSLHYATAIGLGLKKQLKSYKTKVRGYKKGALFYVLIGSRMPSLLVEVGFLSNDRERKLLQQKKYLNEIADSILDGVEKMRHSKKLSSHR
ncbi:N-acetylmuramoyl-L-alanine amidase [bacterium]|nr:N-acetylmuramoyl-L-alanine amidase [bacterium]